MKKSSNLKKFDGESKVVTPPVRIYSLSEPGCAHPSDYRSAGFCIKCGEFVGDKGYDFCDKY